MLLGKTDFIFLTQSLSHLNKNIETLSFILTLTNPLANSADGQTDDIFLIFPRK